MARKTLTIQDRIRTRINSRGPGRVHIPQDFLDLGTRASVDSALHRLVQDGSLRRAGRGLYHFPEEGKFGAVPPADGELVAAIGRRTGSVVQIAGASALNRLGLSTQVPARLTYLTDGPGRTLNVGGRMIEFRNASSRNLLAPGTTAGLVFQALRALGRDGVDAATLRHLARVLGEDELRALRRIRARMPAWMQDAIRELLD